ncbi:MAG: TIGR04282 family arsenosugar biosynthesis glycosyltransferase [Gemmatales bacterium]|nr:TIGR04282 family arsenosugar biosynthesis glycosyltransferase [Gemmatales bacterium]MDW7994257.1 TIGR04282 family arsenosugar biosynthesis glycosyltransferase [Gemmatales bacterium]
MITDKTIVRSLVILAKWPEVGHAKTRLAEAFGSATAARMAEAFLRDTLFRFATLPARKILAFAPKEAEPFFANLANKAYLLKPQVLGDLGARLQALLLQEWRDGNANVVFIGTDSPTLPLTWIDQAFEHLMRADVVIGPARDGGYYLLGCRLSPRWLAILHQLSLWSSISSPTLTDESLTRSRLPIFADIAWGTSQVLQQTLRQVESANLRLALLPLWYDVDNAEDWAYLAAHSFALQYAGVDPLIPHTEMLLRGHGDE